MDQKLHLEGQIMIIAEDLTPEEREKLTAVLKENSKKVQI